MHILIFYLFFWERCVKDGGGNKSNSNIVTYTRQDKPCIKLRYKFTKLKKRKKTKNLWLLILYFVCKRNKM